MARTDRRKCFLSIHTVLASCIFTHLHLQNNRMQSTLLVGTCAPVGGGKSVFFHSPFMAMSEIWCQWPFIKTLPSAGPGPGKWSEINVDNTMCYTRSNNLFKKKKKKKNAPSQSLANLPNQTLRVSSARGHPAWGYGSALRGEREPLSPTRKDQKSITGAFTMHKEWFYEFIDHLVELLYPIKPYFTQCWNARAHIKPLQVLQLCP